VEDVNAPDLDLFGGASAREVEVHFAHALALRGGLVKDVGKADVAALWLARRLCCKSLKHFIRWVRPDYIFAQHHEEIIEEIETLERGGNRRLVVSAPPRHGKSLLTSILAPAWVLGRHPDWDIVVASYGAELSQTFGRQFRHLIRSPEYHEIFPDIELDESSQSIDNMRTMRGGGALFIGRGGALTGRGFHWGVVDDSLKDAGEGSSAIIKAALVEWFRSVFITRQAPGATICITATRWALDDLTGTVLRESEAGGEHYRHLHYKAIDSEGNALWPQRFPVAQMAAIRDVVGKRIWRCLYLNDPVADEGNFFLFDWLGKTFTPMDMPAHSRLVAASDFALSAGAGDFTVHVIMGVIRNSLGADEYYLVDLWRKQAPIEESVSALVLLLQKHRDVSAYLCEHDNIVQASSPYIMEKMHAARLHPRFLKLSRVGNKEAKAGPLQGALEAGRVYFPVGAPWLTDLTTEFMAFPDGLHDDIVDACANVIRGVVGGQVKPRRTDNVYEFPELAYDATQPFGGNVQLRRLWDTAPKMNDRGRI
jgi:predicted phage terminase large subunit-like protein